MNGMRSRSLLVPLLVTVVALTACEGDEGPENSPAAIESPSPTPGQSPEIRTGSACENEGEAVATGDSGSGHTISGPGPEVEAQVVVDPDAPAGCQAFLMVRTEGVTSSNVIPGDVDLNLYPPQIAAMADMDGLEGPEVFVTVQAGASTQFGRIFLLAPDAVRPVTFEDQTRTTGDLVAFGGSVTHLDGAACAPGKNGTVVISSAISQGKGYRLERRFYRFDDEVLVEDSSESLRASFHQLVDNYPEFSTTPFDNCFS